MDNGLLVRLQVTPSQLSVQLITKDGNRSIAVAGSTTTNTTSSEELALREKMYMVAKQLQPSTAKELRAITSTVLEEAGRKAYKPG